MLVIDNQSVKQGDLLVQLDTKDLDAKLASARADLASARAGLASAQVSLKLTQANVDASLRQARGGLTQATSGVQATRSALAQSRAEVDAAEAANRLAQSDWVRAQDLAKAEAISRADIDARRARAEQAGAALGAGPRPARQHRGQPRSPRVAVSPAPRAASLLPRPPRTR